MMRSKAYHVPPVVLPAQHMPLPVMSVLLVGVNRRAARANVLSACRERTNPKRAI